MLRVHRVCLGRAGVDVGSFRGPVCVQGQPVDDGAVSSPNNSRVQGAGTQTGDNRRCLSSGSQRKGRRDISAVHPLRDVVEQTKIEAN